MVIQYRKNNESLQHMSTSCDKFYMKSEQVKSVKPVSDNNNVFECFITIFGNET